MGRCVGGPDERPRHQCGLCRDRLGHGGRAPRAEIASRPGGWQMFHGGHDGVAIATPMSQSNRAKGEKAWFGWPNSPPVEAAIAMWFESKTPEEEKAAARALNKAALADVVYAPLGFYLAYHAWRKNVSGIAQGPLPFFWCVSKTASKL